MNQKPFRIPLFIGFYDFFLFERCPGWAEVNRVGLHWAIPDCRTVLCLGKQGGPIPNRTILLLREQYTDQGTHNCRKLVIIGDGACGKTSLLSVFTLGYFPTVSVSNLSDLYQTTMANICYHCSIMSVSPFLPPVRVHIRNLTEYALIRSLPFSRTT